MDSVFKLPCFGFPVQLVAGFICIALVTVGVKLYLTYIAYR